MKATLISLLASGATASITTSFWLPLNFLGTDRITYVASVVGADKDRMTLAAQPTNDPDYEALGLHTDNPFTATFASTLFENGEPGGRATIMDLEASLRCEIQTPGATVAACTESIGAGIARLQCNRPRISRPAQTMTREWTFSDPGTQGVETIVRTFPGSPTTPVPDWCSAISGSQGPVPSSVLTHTVDVPTSSFRTFTFIITAGEEKLPPATTAGAPTTSTATPTGSAPSAKGTATSSTGKGAASPMNTVAPALAALGAAVAGFL